MHPILAAGLLIAIFALGFQVGQIVARREWRSLANKIEDAVRKQYAQYWEAKFGTPSPTIRNDKGEAKVIDLRMRK